MKHILVQFTRREAHPFIQFIKYGICGVLATVVDVVVFYLLAWKVIPALQPDDIVVKLLSLNVVEISEKVRSLNYVFDRALTFLVSNFVAYITNVIWVFESGRHGRRKEILLFYVVSLISFVLGTFIGWFLIAVFHISTTAAFVANIVVSVMINYAGRKFLIFKG